MTPYERYLNDTSIAAAKVTSEAKNGCCGCFFFFIIIIVLLALL